MADFFSFIFFYNFQGFFFFILLCQMKIHAIFFFKHSEQKHKED